MGKQRRNAKSRQRRKGTESGGQAEPGGSDDDGGASLAGRRRWRRGRAFRRRREAVRARPATIQAWAAGADFRTLRRRWPISGGEGCARPAGRPDAGRDRGARRALRRRHGAGDPRGAGSVERPDHLAQGTREQTIRVEYVERDGQLYQPHPGQHEILRHPARFKVVACGRRFGKTETGKILLIERALAGASGGGSARRIAWRTMCGAAEVGVGRGDARKNEEMRRLDVAGGGVIRVRSGRDPDGLRGAGLDLAVLDEAAYLHPDVWRAAIRPALADRREALFLSTPRGRNWFWACG